MKKVYLFIIPLLLNSCKESIPKPYFSWGKYSFDLKLDTFFYNKRVDTAIIHHVPLMHYHTIVKGIEFNLEVNAFPIYCSLQDTLTGEIHSIPIGDTVSNYEETALPVDTITALEYINLFNNAFRFHNTTKNHDKDLIWVETDIVTDSIEYFSSKEKAIERIKKMKTKGANIFTKILIAPRDSEYIDLPVLYFKLR